MLGFSASKIFLLYVPENREGEGAVDGRAEDKPCLCRLSIYQATRDRGRNTLLL